MIRKIIFTLSLTSIVLFSFGQHTKSDQAKIPLTGTWKFALDLSDEGVHKKWYLGNLKDKYLGNVMFTRDELKDNEFVTSLEDEIILPTTTDLAGWGLPDQSPWINYLQRKHKYIGACWFQRIIDIPEDWEGHDAELFLERVKWQSRVWFDGAELSTSPQDGLVTSHHHFIPSIKPGKHLISIRVDNRMIHPIGDKGHNYTEQTESIWNGIVGKIELRKKPKVTITQLRFFPQASKKTLEVKGDFSNARSQQQEVILRIQLANAKTGYVESFERKINLPVGRSEQSFLLQPKEAKRWDEFEPNLYTASCELVSGDGEKDYAEPITFGYRDLSVSSYKVLINGRPTYIRGNQEALGYPLTGHPPMDVETWREIFRKYKDYGLNQVRFHSSCPPAAAFRAADELGIYVMVELVWMTSINAKKDLRPISATTGIPQGIGHADRTIDDFVKAETKRLLDQYGSHPSFVFFAFGNELDNLNKDTVNQWIGDFKKYDNRHLYAGTTARAVLPNDDFQDSHIVPGKGAVVNKDDFSNLTNYDQAYRYTTVPVIAHELGQYPVFPRWSEIDKYKDTPFRFKNLEKARALAVKNGVVDMDSIFRVVSGATQQMLYKSEIERQLRSRYSGGFNLLQMNDYTGQGEALVGWLDAFYDSKGITTPEKFRQFCNDVVVLAEFDSRTYQEGDTLSFGIKVHTNNPFYTKAKVKWDIRDAEGNTMRSGNFGSKSLVLAEPTLIGQSAYRWKESNKATKYVLSAYTADGLYENHWEFWVYPKKDHAPIEQGDVIVTDDVSVAKQNLLKGKKVLLLANQLGNAENQDLVGFKPVFWSTLFFPGRGVKTLGTLIRNDHPLFKQFPTENYASWQWRDICEHARGFVLPVGSDLAPIAQPIHDFHFNQKLMSLLEVKVGQGKLLISGYDLSTDLDRRLSARQLLVSTLAYMNSDDFNPTQSVADTWLDELFEDVRIEQAKFIPVYHKGLQVILPADVAIQERGKGLFALHTKLTIIGKVRIKLKCKPNTKEKSTTIYVDGRETPVSFVQSTEQTVDLQYFREDFDDQKLEIRFSDPDKIIIQSIELLIEN